MNTEEMEELRRSHAMGDDPLAYIPYARALLKAKEIPQALDVCARGLEERPALAGRNLLAQIYYSMGRYENALETLQSVLRDAPDSFQGNLTLAKVRVRRGEWPGAAEIVERLKKANASDPEVVALDAEVNDGLERHARLTPIDTAADFATPADYGQFKEVVSGHLARQQGVGFCSFIEPVEGDVRGEQDPSRILGAILHKSTRIAAELGLGTLEGMMLEYENGYVLISRSGGEFLATQFSPAIAPGQMRRTMARYLSLKP